jgi:hypothetical protein
MSFSHLAIAVFTSCTYIIRKRSRSLLKSTSQRKASMLHVWRASSTSFCLLIASRIPGNSTWSTITLNAYPTRKWSVTHNPTTCNIYIFIFWLIRLYYGEFLHIYTHALLPVNTAVPARLTTVLLREYTKFREVMYYPYVWWQLFLSSSHLEDSD